MLADFIEQNSTGLWLQSAENNFSHDYTNINIIENHLGENSIIKNYADRTIDIMEKLLDNIKAVFIDRNDSFNSHDRDIEKSRELNDSQKSVRSSILFHYEITLLEKILAGGSIYNSKHPLLKEMKARWEKFKACDSLDENLLPRNILYDIYLFPFTIVRNIYTTNNLAQAIYNESLYYRKSLKELLAPTIHAIIKSDLQKEMQLFLTFIQQLITTRTNDLDNFKITLALGFAGKLFDKNAMSNVKNTIFLAFSRSGKQEWHTFFLTLLRNELAYKKTWPAHQFLYVPNIHIINENNLESFDYYKKDKIDHYKNLDLDQKVYKYILEQLFDKIFVQVHQSVHSTIQAVWIEQVLNIIENYAKNLKRSDKNTKMISQLNNKLKSRLLPLTTEETIFLKQIVIEDQTFSCAESLISRYGKTNIYTPITFRPQHEEQIKFNEAPMFLGKKNTRALIPPCRHCQLLSTAYMIWSHLTKEWNIGELQEIATIKNKPKIPNRFLNEDKKPPSINSNLEIKNKPESFLTKRSLNEINSHKHSKTLFFKNNSLSQHSKSSINKETMAISNLDGEIRTLLNQYQQLIHSDQTFIETIKHNLENIHKKEDPIIFLQIYLYSLQIEIQKLTQVNHKQLGLK